VASPLRALALLPFALALTACGNKPGPEDPAVAVSTGIPMGAPKASGVGLAAAAVTPASNADIGKLEAVPMPMPIPLPKALPPDPFDPGGQPEPVEPGDVPAPPKGPKPPKKGMQL
jgi:hypothetical protein